MGNERINERSEKVQVELREELDLQTSLLDSFTTVILSSPVWRRALLEPETQVIFL